MSKRKKDNRPPNLRRQNNLGLLERKERGYVRFDSPEDAVRAFKKWRDAQLKAIAALTSRDRINLDGSGESVERLQAWMDRAMSENRFAALKIQPGELATAARVYTHAVGVQRYGRSWTVCPGSIHRDRYDPTWGLAIAPNDTWPWKRRRGQLPFLLEVLAFFREDYESRNLDRVMANRKRLAREQPHWQNSAWLLSWGIDPWDDADLLRKFVERWPDRKNYASRVWDILEQLLIVRRSSPEARDAVWQRIRAVPDDEKISCMKAAAIIQGPRFSTYWAARARHFISNFDRELRNHALCFGLIDLDLVAAVADDGCVPEVVEIVTRLARRSRRDEAHGTIGFATCYLARCSRSNHAARACIEHLAGPKAKLTANERIWMQDGLDAARTRKGPAIIIGRTGCPFPARPMNAERWLRHRIARRQQDELCRSFWD